MNGRFRKTIFWLHLVAGLVAGVIIFVMSFTGVTLAFEKEITTWFERGERVVTAPADAKPLPLDDLIARVREHKPDERPSGITLDADSNAAVLFSFGRTNSAYVNPFTGEIREPSSNSIRSFLQTMLTWHRFLGAGEERRAVGKEITGACNVAFCFLAMSGLYLWWPRKTMKAVVMMSFKLRGKARDWNWHNAVGLWSAPVLIVLTLTAMPMSYRWANDLIYKLTGTTPPGSGPGSAASVVEIPTPPEGAKRLGMSALFTAVQKEFPQWKQISYRSGGRGGREGAPRSGGTGEPSREARGPQPGTMSVVEKGGWPLFATTQLTLDPFTGNILRKEGFADFNLGRKVRSWARFLHTGEALGTVGKLVAGLASAGSLLLVWTGFALACRRFFSRKRATSAETST